MPDTTTLYDLLADPNKELNFTPLSSRKLKGSLLRGVSEIAILLGYWANSSQSHELEDFFARLVAANMTQDNQPPEARLIDMRFTSLCGRPA